MLLLARPSALSRAPRPGWILLVAVLARLILFPSQLILENDVYRYVLDGQVVLAGENPYSYSPQELRLLTYHPLAEPLETPEAQLVLNRIGFPEIPTIYPPLAQFAFAAGSWLGGWDWKAQRTVFLMCDLALIFLLWRLLHHLKFPPGALALYAWNPLVLKEVANSAHLDVLVALALIMAIWALRDSACRDVSTGGWGRVLLGSLVLAGAVSTKLYPVILMPVFCLFLLRRRSWVKAMVFGIATSVWIGLSYLPFLDAGAEQLFAGLITYGTSWQMNEGLFWLLTLLPWTARGTALFLAGSFALLLPLIAPTRRYTDLIVQCQAVLLVWFLLLPAAFPWYVLPLVAVSTLSPGQPLSRSTWVISGMAAAYYLSFYVEYHELNSAWWGLVRILEYAVILGSLIWFWLRRDR